MRTLKFIVEGDRVRKDRTCLDFNDAYIPDDEPVNAEFIFGPEWNSYPIRVVAFFDRTRKECPPRTLDKNMRCVIPDEALRQSILHIQVLGIEGGGKLGYNVMKTDRCAICWIGR